MLVIRADPQGLDSYGELEIEVPAFGRTFKVVIHLADGADTVSDKTARSIDDIANLTSESRCRIRKLLYDDAMRARQEVAFGDPTAPPEEAPSGFFRRLFRRPGKYRFVALGLDDPRHPCCFKNGVEGVDEKVQWLEFRIDEGQDVEHRFALLDCRPAWEEHGITVVIRDGIPMAVDDYLLDLEKYDRD